MLSTGKSYQFKITFSADFGLLPACPTFNLELEIAPVQTGISPDDCPPALPPTNLFIFFTDGLYNYQYDCSFTQSQTPFVHKISFLTSNYTHFRSMVAFNFVWSSLSIRLLDNNNNGSRVAFGLNGNNQNEIKGQDIPPGNYTLEIYEPETTISEENRCTEFTLTVGISLIYQDTVVLDDTYKDCQLAYFPPTFDSISYLSEISGQMFHFAREVLIPVTVRTSIAQFHILVPSDFKIYIPPHKVDIDLQLMKLDPITEIPDQNFPTQRSTTLQEESIACHLDIGYYKLFLTYYPRYNLDYYFPQKDECVSFPVELSIVPTSYTLDHVTSTTCPNEAPTSLELSAHRLITIPKPINTPFNISLPFSLKDESLFTADLQHSFIPGGGFMILEGNNIRSPFVSAPTHKVWYAYVGKNTQFFDQVLWPGEYKLNITDNTVYQKGTRCTNITLDYFLEVGKVPPNYCDDADKLPTDLASIESAPYGGPQNADGSVRISGNHFIMPAKQSHNYMAFKINNSSYVRYWAGITNSKNDIDFYLWNNASKNYPIDVSLGMGSVESRLIKLEPQTEAYLLDITVFSRSDLECDYLSFEFSIETNSSYVSSIRCPDPLPNPVLPPSSILLAGSSPSIYRQFYFTYDYIKDHKIDFSSYSKLSYDINLEITQPTQITAILGYDFTFTDFTLDLIVNGTIISNTKYDAPKFLDPYIDFEATIMTTLSPGRAVLRITETLYNILPVHVGECHRFSFLLQSETSSTDPVVVSVLPPAGSELDPYSPIIITTEFSHPVGLVVPRDFFGLDTWIREHNAVYLLNNGTIWFPTITVFENDYTLKTTFYSLLFGATYTLYINATQFVTQNNNTHFLPHEEKHTYSTIDCQCGGHGHCASQAWHVGHCECDYPYAGDECKTCLAGYHRETTHCVANTFCASNTCNGHGNCTDTSGFPYCSCDNGYDSTYFCSQCQIGYSGYPDCVPNVDDRTSSCTSPLLPTDLNTISFLKPDGSVHIQGDYYLDVNHLYHEMTFSLSVESFFRVYTEPHEIDIDFWLYQENTLIAFRYSLYQEESIFMKLEAGKSYSLKIFYLSPRTKVGPCPTFNFELAISPTSVVGPEISSYGCEGTLELPSIASGAIPPNGISLLTNTIYRALTNPNTEIYTLNFTVNPQPNKLLFVQVDLEYRFLIGALAIKLERTDLVNTTFVTTGFNHLNTHHLQYTLREGQYKLTLYYPSNIANEITTCVPFQFKFLAEFISAENDMFVCDYPRFPKTFNQIPYQGDEKNVYGDFMVEPDGNNITLKLEYTSTIRIQAYSDIPFHLELCKQPISGGETVIQQFDNDGQFLFIYLDNMSTYVVRIKYYSYDRTAVLCPTITFEMSVMPNARLLGLRSNYNCPGGNIPVWPTLPTHIPAPYHFNANVTPEPIYYTFLEYSNSIDYSFTLDNNVYMEIGIASHFLTANLQLELKYLSSQDGIVQTIKSRNSIDDYNFIAEELHQGDYSLRILLPVEPIANLSLLVPCVPFNLHINVEPIDVHLAEPCLDNELELLPTSLNSMRYLGFERSVTLQSYNWQIPLIQSSSTALHSINFTLVEKSVIRVMVDERTLDVDVMLYQGINFIAGGFNKEEFVITIDPGDYKIDLYFFSFGRDGLVCPSFNMELSIVPVTVLPPVIPRCDQTVKFPDVLELINTLPYAYEQDTEFYYTQDDHTEANKKLWEKVVRFDNAVDVHIEIAFNFLFGDMRISIKGEKDEKPTYGLNELHRNVLNIKNLPAGNYNIQLVEPAPNEVKNIGCNKFLFSMHVDKADVTSFAQKLNDPRIDLPVSLNSVAYLKFSNYLHIEGSYIFLHNTPSNNNTSISFTLQKESLVRISLGKQSPFLLNLSPLDPHQPSVFTSLTPGSYQINFYLIDNRREQHVYSDVEIQFLPKADLNSRLESTNCGSKTAIWQPPAITYNELQNGQYSFRDKLAYLLENQITTNSDIYNIDLNLIKEEVLSIQLQYDFILSDIILYVKNKDLIDDPVRYATKRYNLQDLKVRLAPSHYVIAIQQLKPWVDISVPAPRCLEFDVRISLSNMSNTDRVECSDYSLIPWDLNTEAGGSLPWGGPIISGHLILYHDRFLLSSDRNTVVSKLRIDTDVLLFVYMSGDSLDDFLSFGSTIITPIASETNYWAKKRLYRLSTLGDYNLQLNYVTFKWTVCSHITMGIAMDPVTVVSNYTNQLCNSGQPVQLPDRITSKSTQINSYFTEEYITQNSVDGVFLKKILFSCKKGDIFDATFKFDPLVSMFSFVFWQEDPPSYPAVTPDWVIERQGPDGKLYISQRIQYTCYQDGEYSIHISQPGIPKPNQAAKNCIPFTFKSELLTNMTSTAIIRTVSPDSSTGLDPQKDLYLKLKFSDLIYVKNKEGALNQITRNDNIDILRTSIILKDSNNNIVPVSAAPSGDPVLNDLTQWELVFSFSKFEYGKTYKLTLLESYLFDRNGNPVLLPSLYQYTMKVFDMSCSGKGHYDAGQKICICNPDTHRAGITCERCSLGYDQDKTGQCVLTETCAIWTCGCYGSGEICSPIGNCTYNPATPLSRITCSCPELYTGDRCEKCKAGYGGHPFCRLTCPNGCGDHGVCVNTTCICSDGYGGDTCSDIQAGGNIPILAGILISGILMFIIAFVIYKVAKHRKVEVYIDHDHNEFELDKVNGDGTDFGLGDEEPHNLEIPSTFNNSDDEDDNTLLQN